MLATFFRCLYSSKLREDGKDKWWWVPSRKGDFEVKSFYRALSAQGPISFPWKSIWRSKAPPRVAFFAWTAAQGKILTLDNIRRRGMVVVTNVGSVSWMESRLIISNFIVGLLGLYGMLFSPDLGFVGLCLALLEIYMPAGGRVAVRGVRLFGKWFPYALCGVSGGSVMTGALRTSRGLKRNLVTCSSLSSIHGLRGGWPRV